MDLNWDVVGTAIGAVAAVATGIWATILKFKKSVAEAKADVAVAKSEQVTADANSLVYGRLSAEIDKLYARVEKLEKANAAKDEVIRQLHQHISRLEQLMREKGIEPPTLIIAPLKD